MGCNSQGIILLVKFPSNDAIEQWFLPPLFAKQTPLHINNVQPTHTYTLSHTYIYTAILKIKQHFENRKKKSAKYRSFTIDDEVDGNSMDPNLEEPLKAKLRRELSRQGAKSHSIFQPKIKQHYIVLTHSPAFASTPKPILPCPDPPYDPLPHPHSIPHHT